MSQDELGWDGMTLCVQRAYIQLNIIEPYLSDSILHFVWLAGIPTFSLIYTMTSQKCLSLNGGKEMDKKNVNVKIFLNKN